MLPCKLQFPGWTVIYLTHLDTTLIIGTQKSSPGLGPAALSSPGALAKLGMASVCAKRLSVIALTAAEWYHFLFLELCRMHQNAL